MSYEYKNNMISAAAFSGSADRLRTALGAGYWMPETDPDDGTQYLIFSDIPLIAAASTWPEDNDMVISEIKYNTTFRDRVSDEKIMSNWKMPVRLVGNPDKIENDEFWKSYLVGGTFGGDKFDGVFVAASASYIDCSFTYDMPWPKIQTSIFPDYDFDKVIEIYPYYKTHLRDYQEDIAGEPEQLMFNAYAYASTYIASVNAQSPLNPPIEDTVDPDILKFVTRENMYPMPPYIAPDQWALAMNSYYESMVALPLSGSTENAVVSKLRHIILDEDAFRNVASSTSKQIAIKKLSGDPHQDMGPDYNYSSDSIIELVNSWAEGAHAGSGSAFPYFVGFKIPFDAVGPYGQAIMENNLSARFMKTLKESFSWELEGLSPSWQSYGLKQEYSYFDTTEGTINPRNIAGTTNARYLNYVDMLTYMYDNYLSKTSNSTFINFFNWRDKATYDGLGTYRYSNTIDTYNTLLDLIKNTESRYDLTDSGEPQYFIENLEELYNAAGPDSKHVETLAYRIEKIGGEPTGDRNTQNVLQDYWIFNASDAAAAAEDALSTEFKFYDTQVGYVSAYTYNIYAYVLVGGLKYHYSDLRITRKIGETTYAVDPGGTYPAHDANCLEFYDPNTGDAVPQLIADTDELAEFNELVTNSQITDPESYLADFNLSYEPYLKLIEIPLFTKTVRVMDHPGNAVNIEPFYLKNQSNIVGFKADYGVYYPRSMPLPVDKSDLDYNVEYLISNDMTSDQKVVYPAGARPMNLQVYRMSAAPGSYADFEGSQHADVDLTRKYEDTDSKTNMVCYYDKIKPNTKYYYLFRIVTENFLPGYVSPIYETELVNNGGYSYVDFKALYLQDLQEESSTIPSKEMKKIFHLQPNMSHLMFDTGLVDFTQPANTQLDKLTIGNASDSIWGKTFKIRLTSKKTGKKIDLNVTYNLNSE